MKSFGDLKSHFLICGVVSFGGSLILSCSQPPAFVETAVLDTPLKASGAAVDNSNAQARTNDGDLIVNPKSDLPENGGVNSDSTPPQIKDKALRSVKKTFQASHLESGTTHFSLSEKMVESEIILRRPDVEDSLHFVQDTRPSVAESFFQGANGTAVVETFKQKDLGVLDILVVVDNSGSMSQEQANLSTKLSPLLSSVQDSSWKIGIITTDNSNSSLRGLVQKGDPDPLAAFKTAVSAGTSGSGDERGIGQAVAGLKNPGFLRDGSSLAVLIVSDENNCSTGPGGCSTAVDKDETYLTNYIKDDLKKVLRDQARVYAIVKVPGVACSSASFDGVVYKAAVEASSGKIGSICDADYTSTLQAISSDMKVILDNSWALKQLPDAGVIEVRVNDVALSASDYSLTGKNLSFTNPPPLNASIKVSYNSGKSGVVAKEFALGKKLFPGSETVLVNGVAVNSKNYSIKVGATSTLVFNDAPAQNGSINITYKEHVVLRNSFDIGTSALEGSLVVKVNGVASAFLHDKVHGRVNLSQVPNEAAEIVVSFRKNGSPVLRYPLNIGSAVMADLKVREAEGAGLALAASYDEGFVVFNAADVTEGKRVKVSFRDESVQAQAFTLPVSPLPETVVIRTVPGSCGEGSLVTVNKNIVSALCAIVGNADVNIDYKYIADVQTKFEVTDIPSCGSALWDVKVNNELFKQFKREGCTIIPDGDLPVGAEVTITVTEQ